MAQKNFLLVGGTSGIGGAVRELLVSQGHSVWTAARNNPDGFDHHITLDITQDPWPTTALPEMIDGFVYCPGSINLKPFHRLTDDEFRADFEINALGAVRSVRAVLPHLRAAGDASVVLFSSVAVQQGMPFHASVAMAKGAIEGLVRSLAAELAPVIRVNAVAPSLTDTPMASRFLSTDEKRKASGDRHPLRRIGQADEIARAVVHLLVDATWTTGQVIAVDGGLSRLRIG
jgi:NAD(P)-dependent dehydrogenase (short-subunit alcohol dehydrogenase family)